MASPVLNFGAYSPTELNAMLTAAKAELLVRMGTGRVKSGGSAAQQYGMDVMTYDQLVQLINGLTAALGLDNNVTIRARPNFNTNQVAPTPGQTFGA